MRYAYQGDRLTQVTDVAGQVWRYDYDDQGQLIRRTAPLMRLSERTEAAGNQRLTRLASQGYGSISGFLSNYAGHYYPSSNVISANLAAITRYRKQNNYHYKIESKDQA